VTADPGARKPTWTHYSTADGLSSDNVNALAEDHLGRVYAGTTRGLDRLDPEVGRVRTFTSRDGLAGEFVSDVITDRHGRVWVATTTGLTRIDPGPEEKPGPPPPALFTRVQVAGEELRLPERGTREIPPLALGPSQNNLVVEYVGVSLQSDAPLRYQHRLDGADADWSAPGEQRSIHYARLAPGSYRLRVRVAGPEGRTGPEPAVLAFEIARPWWRSRAFLAAALVVLALGVESLHRLRLRRRVELEAVRTRIATDLHDDIGSNLSRIAILTEVARHDLDGASPAVKERLEHVASISRDLVDSMGDIVWAINPARDRLRDLTRRMRHFAEDVLAARDIALRFRAPTDGDELALGPGVRRELFLVFKEAVHNVARHSDCRSVEIDLGTADGWLVLRVWDDGRGLGPRRVADPGGGNGLPSMKRRAEGLGGTLDVVSGPGGGTALALRVPVGRVGWARRALRRVPPLRW
jgi:signal transduction histidine kinase